MNGVSRRWDALTCAGFVPQRQCPPIFQQSAGALPSQGQPGAQQQQQPPAAQHAMDRLGSVPLQRGPSGDPDWVPGLARAASEGGGDANQGRCKCGERAPSAVQCN